MSKRKPAAESAALAQQVVVSFFRIASALERLFAAVVATEGLTLSQFNVLRILKGAMPETLSAGEIRRRMIHATPGITRLLDGLEAQGLVRRVRATDDRRVLRCAITANGLAALNRLALPVLQADRRVTHKLSARDLRLLSSLHGLVEEGVNG
ncbi:MAG: MarR family transcriptional regulator [Acidobacteria bacterium]|nr:MarR family transcriptional regulator [Acidobacteriota bacterium]